MTNFKHSRLKYFKNCKRLFVLINVWITIVEIYKVQFYNFILSAWSAFIYSRYSTLCHPVSLVAYPPPNPTIGSLIAPCAHVSIQILSINGEEIAHLNSRKNNHRFRLCPLLTNLMFFIYHKASEWTTWQGQKWINAFLIKIKISQGRHFQNLRK